MAGFFEAIAIACRLRPDSLKWLEEAAQTDHGWQYAIRLLKLAEIGPACIRMGTWRSGRTVVLLAGRWLPCVDGRLWQAGVADLAPEGLPVEAAFRIGVSLERIHELDPASMEEERWLS